MAQRLVASVSPKHQEQIASAIAVFFVFTVIYVLVALWQAGNEVENYARELDQARDEELLSGS